MVSGLALSVRASRGEILSDRENVLLFEYECGRPHPYATKTLAGVFECHCQLCNESRKRKS